MDVSVTLPPVQNVVLVPAVITDADGIAFTVIAMALETGEEQPLAVTIEV